MWQNKLMGVGFSAEQAKQLSGQGAQALTATGSSATDALLLSSHHNAFSTVGSGTGAIVSTSLLPGDSVYVYNGGANTLAIYPPTGATVDNTTSVSLVTLKGCLIVMGATNKFTSHIST